MRHLEETMLGVVKRQLKVLSVFVLLVLLGYGLASPMAAQSLNSQQQSVPGPGYWDDPVNWKQQFVPDSLAFWDDSKNWTTNYGPAYRDTNIKGSQLLACSTQFAYCFNSGPEPLPCTLSPDGLSANCQCPVQTKTNYTLLTAILNYSVYQATLQACGPDGSNCMPTGNTVAPVCTYLPGGALIPGANVISTFAPEFRLAMLKAIEKGSAAVATCPKGPYAGCMTAPCEINSDGSTATCKCPVFSGRFQLTGSSGANAKCSLGGGLIWSASYNPSLDSNPTQ